VKTLAYLKKPEEMGEFEVNVRLFGKLEIENKWGKVNEPRANRAGSWMLLKYLLANAGREITQEELQDAILPGGAESDTDGNARVRLTRARKVLEPLHLNGAKRGLILFNFGKYSVNPEYDIYSDEACFLELKRKIKASPVGDPAGMELCIEAIELFRGPYLDDVQTRPWIDSYRRAYANEFAALGLDTLSRVEALGDARAVPLLCRRAVAIAPDAEELHKALVKYLVEQKEEVELLRYISQLARTGVEWVSKLRY